MGWAGVVGGMWGLRGLGWVGQVVWGRWVVWGPGVVGPGGGGRDSVGSWLGVPKQAHLPRPHTRGLAVAVKDSSHLCSEGVGVRAGLGWAPAGPWSARPHRDEAVPLGRSTGPSPAAGSRWGGASLAGPPGAADGVHLEPRQPRKGQGDGRGRGHQSSLPGPGLSAEPRLPAWGSGGTEAALQSRGTSPSQH